MRFLLAFVVGGAICVMGQVLIDKTKLTPARILVGFVLAGVLYYVFNLVVAMVMPVELPLASAVIRQLMAAGPCWALNGWLTRQLMHGNRRYRYLLAVFRADKPEAFTPELLKLPPKVLKLYRLEAGQ